MSSSKIHHNIILCDIDCMESIIAHRPMRPRNSILFFYDVRFSQENFEVPTHIGRSKDVRSQVHRYVIS